jgi:hypothetical protein
MQTMSAALAKLEREQRMVCLMKKKLKAAPRRKRDGYDGSPPVARPATKQYPCQKRIGRTWCVEFHPGASICQTTKADFFFGRAFCAMDEINFSSNVAGPDGLRLVK